MYSQYRTYKNKRDKEDRKKSSWYRYLFPKDADWSIRENLYAKNHHLDIYNPKNSRYSSYSNDFYDHVAR